MQMLPESLYTPAQVRELDRRAIEDAGIPGHVLMARAGRSAWRALEKRWPGPARLLVLCGGGNNGGDGYVIARRAAEAGWSVDLWALTDPQGLEGDARRAAEAALATITPIDDPQPALAEADVVVDALLGTGLDRPVSGRLATLIDAVNAAGCPVLSVDVPSGLHAASGQVMGTAVRATLTPTFIGLKQGLFTGEAADCVGEIRFDDLGVPDHVHAGMTPAARRLPDSAPGEALGPRWRTAHKGCFGHVRVLGGDHGMGGAVRLAGEAAARSGAGRVSVMTRPEHVAGVLAGRPELMVTGLSAESIRGAAIAPGETLALGPGLGQARWGRCAFERGLQHTGALVVDADGLNWLATQPQRRDDWVLTPHPGEAARLLGVGTEAVSADRWATADALVARYGGVVVLKGAGTLIVDAQRRRVVTAGNPGMASGGMGDVLTGIIAGLLAQGRPPFEAACLGVMVHARAADQAARDGERGLLAGDVLAQLRSAVNP
jgi:NAD(P)H-hydrate epimerase